MSCHVMSCHVISYINIKVDTEEMYWDGVDSINVDEWLTVHHSITFFITNFMHKVHEVGDRKVRVNVVWDRVNFRTVVGAEMKLWGP